LGFEAKHEKRFQFNMQDFRYKN